MNILGLHFGHDASASVIRDGRIASHVLRERQSRVKHAVGLTDADIDLALQAAGLSLGQIDAAAVSSTQDMEIMTGLIEDFSIELGESPAHPGPSPYARLLSQANVDVGRMLSHGMRGHFAVQPGGQYGMVTKYWMQLFAEWPRFSRGELDNFGWLNAYTTHN